MELKKIRNSISISDGKIQNCFRHIIFKIAFNEKKKTDMEKSPLSKKIMEKKYKFLKILLRNEKKYAGNSDIFLFFYYY